MLTNDPREQTDHNLLLARWMLEAMFNQLQPILAVGLNVRDSGHLNQEDVDTSIKLNKALFEIERAIGRALDEVQSFHLTLDIRALTNQQMQKHIVAQRDHDARTHIAKKRNSIRKEK